MILINSDKISATTPGAVSKKETLYEVLVSFQLEDLVSKIKEMRLKKKLIGEKKMSEIKRLLEELVKDPRKRVK